MHSLVPFFSVFSYLHIGQLADSVAYEFVASKLFRYSDKNDSSVGLVNNPS